MRTEFKLAAVVALLIIGGGIFWSQYGGKGNNSTDNKIKFDPPPQEKENRTMLAGDMRATRDKDKTPPSGGPRTPATNNNHLPALARQPDFKAAEPPRGNDPSDGRPVLPKFVADGNNQPAGPAQPKPEEKPAGGDSGALAPGARPETPAPGGASPGAPPSSRLPAERSSQDPASSGEQPLTLKPPSAGAPQTPPAVPSNVQPKDKPASEEPGPIVTPPKREEAAKPTNLGTTGNRPAGDANKPSGDPNKPTPPRGGKTYAIQDGDTLAAIARDEYGQDKYWTAIQAANPDLDPQRLFVGKLIVLPPKETIVGGAAAPRPAAADAGAARKPADGNGGTPANQTNSSGNATGNSGTSSTPPNAAAPGGTHVVAKNETLIVIARTVLKDETRWREIYELNRDKLSSPDVVFEGLTLRLPGPKEKSNGDAKKPAGKPAGAKKETKAPPTAGRDTVKKPGTP